jgi:hypothetical protein
MCKSAGTLIAIAMDELAIGDLGELGPLDMQIVKSSELMENGSSLDIQQALGSILEQAQAAFRSTLMDIRKGAGLSTRLAGEFASKMAVGLVEPLYAQVDPIRIGEHQRAMQITHEYGSRLNEYSHNLKDGALEKLVASYPSHGFVIDRKEATMLFNRVSHLTSQEEEFSVYFWNVLRIVTDRVVFFPGYPKFNQGDAHEENKQINGAEEICAEPIQPKEETDRDAADSGSESA